MPPDGVPRPVLFRVLLGLGLWFSAVRDIQRIHAAEPAIPSTPQLQLQNGGLIAGWLHAAAPFGTISWQGADFTSPFEFPLGTLRRVQFPQRSQPVDESDRLLFQLISGDQLSGQLKSWSSRVLVIEADELGPVGISTASLKRIVRMGKNSSVIYPRLDGLQGWSGKKENWTEDGFVLSTSHDEAALARDLKIPKKAIIEFEVAWEGVPNFVISLAGQNVNSQGAKDTGWRIECWDQSLVLLRELKSVADLCPITGINLIDGRLHLTAYLDQTTGEMQLLHPDGTIAAHLKLAAPEPGGVLQLFNRRGKFRLEQLSVMPWHGTLPHQGKQAEPQFELTDGSTFSGAINSVTELAGTTTLHVGDSSRGIPLSEISAVQLNPVAEPAERPVVIALQNGNRVSGILQKIQDHQIQFITSEVDRTLSIPIKEVLSISLKAASAPPVPSTDNPSARIVLRSPGAPPIKTRPAAEKPVKKEKKPAAGIAANRILVRNGIVVRETQPRQPVKQEEEDDPWSLQHSGELIDGAARKPEAGCLVWQPTGSRTASPLKKQTAGKIIYRVPAPSAPPKSNSQNEQAKGFADLFLKKVDQPHRPAPQTARQSLHLRTGEIISCSLLSINDQGILISSPVVDEQLVPHDKIKALELRSEAELPDLVKAKKERLLTLPRAQKASPPTHLLCSHTGDFLRCRVLAMNQDLLKVEVQLDELQLPLDRVAQIIWFHSDEMVSEAPSPNSSTTLGSSSPASSSLPYQAASVPPESPANDSEEAKAQSPNLDKSAAAWRNQVQALTLDGQRVTFTPREVRAGIISGASDVLGECRFELARLDRLIIGAEISSAAAQLPYQNWRLHPSVEPLVAQDLENGTGTASPLVGKPAPKLDLDLLGGGRFSLSEQRGRIVILDFWATWCGPCIQTIPLMEEMIKEFDPQQVQLVSVNLEEPAQQVQSVMDRHQFKMTVALDQDGVAAHRFQAAAIPQVVVVDAQGTITHVFVGGGPNMIEQLKLALHAQLGDEASDQSPGGPSDTPAPGKPGDGKPAK